MVKAVVRRQADPQTVQHLWEAITFIRKQKQVANKERILKYMNKQYGYSHSDCEAEIEYAAQDGLLVKEISTGKKGSRAGLEQEAFWCVEDLETESTETHDWYCFSCHKPGKVACCTTCYRVFHPECTNNESEDTSDPEWSCTVCKSLEKKKFPIGRSILLQLLNFVLARMKDKARELHRKLKLATLPNYYHLVYRHVDLGTIMERVEQKKYRSLEEFEVNAQDMVHTSAVYYGLKSDRMRLSQLTLNDCRYDLAEIRICVDCYLSSNNKVGKDWFCRPCNPPHELAWVHMKGFGFWPAKILCRSEGRVDVRFFGKRHERALVPEEDVKDINTKLVKLRLKKTQGWHNAHQEMQKHRKIIAGELAMDKKPEKDTSKGDLCEAEEFVKKSHSDAGQVNSISTSQELNHSENPSNKKAKKDKVAAAPEEDQIEESPASQDFTENPIDEEDANPGDEDASPEEESKRKSSSNASKGTQDKKRKTASGGRTSPGGGSDESKSSPEGGGSESSESKGVKRKHAVLEEEDFEGKYRQKLADYKAYQEKEFQARLEKAVEEAIGSAQKKWETERSVSEAETSAQNEELIEEARKEEREKLQQEHAKEINQLKEKHKEEISQTKKRQWCINCEQEAMYHCCWNTSYCSIQCQQIHWHKEHKRLCRRKR